MSDFLKLKLSVTLKSPNVEKIFKVSSIRTPVLIQGRLERTETNLMHFKWEVTNTRNAALNILNGVACE